MKETVQPTILVFGATGMLGHTVYTYLQQQFPGKVVGTHRGETSETHIHFDAELESTELQKIAQKLPSLKFVINCIGAIPQKKYSVSQMRILNTELPQAIAKTWKNIPCILFSTDAVFSDDALLCTEQTKPNPSSEYGTSKYAGEVVQPHVLIIRTSILGIDTHTHSGLIEWILHTPEQTLMGYTNHQWTGATALQCAHLCAQLSDAATFAAIRAQSSVMHFAPLSTTKYEILATVLTLTHLKKTLLAVASDSVRTRQLCSALDYPKGLIIPVKSLKQSLEELFTFEKLRFHTDELKQLFI